MQKAILIAIITQDQDKNQVKEYLEELDFLARTAGVDPIKRFTQRLRVPDEKTFIGKGKLAEVFNFDKENKIKLIIFDDDLTPSQS